MLEISSKFTYPHNRETQESNKPRVTFTTSNNQLQNPSVESNMMNASCDEFQNDNHLNNVSDTYMPSTHEINRTVEEIDNQTLIKYGYLLKRSTKRKVWRKRWFVLRGTSLACYKDNKEYELERIIDLLEAKQILEVTWKTRKNVFAIIVDKKKYYFQAESRALLDEWLSSMDFVLSGLVEDDIPEEQTYARKGPSGCKTLLPYKSNVRNTKECSFIGGDKSKDISHTTMHVPNHSHTSEAVSSEDEEEADEVFDEDEEIELPQVDDNKILLNGYLRKQCEMYKVWRKRWFVLRSNTLSYYKNEKEYVLHKIIPIESIQGAFEKSPTNAKSKRFCFQLITPQRNYLIAAEDQESSHAWLRAINAAIRAKSDHQQS